MIMTNDELKFWKEVYVAYIQSNRSYSDLETMPAKAASVADASVELLRETA